MKLMRYLMWTVEFNSNRYQLVEYLHDLNVVRLEQIVCGATVYDKMSKLSV